MRRLVAVSIAAISVAITLGASACGLPVEDRVTRIDSDELPPVLANTTTTTSTTTSTTTTLPTVTGSTTTSTSTTTMPPSARPISLYYTIGSSDELQESTQLLSERFGLAELIELLESPLDDPRAPSLRTNLVPNLIADSRLGLDNVLYVSLDPTLFESLPEPQRQRAIAQIVLTMTKFTTPDAGNIGAVRFHVGGEPIPVFVPRLGGFNEAGDAVVYQDFDELLARTPVDPEATTPTVPPASDPPSTPATSVPPG